MNKKSLISILLAILMLTLTVSVSAEQRKITLPEYISAYAQRHIDFNGDYNESWPSVSKFDDCYFIGTCNSTLVVDFDLNIISISTVFYNLTDGPNGNEDYMPHILATIAAAELGYYPSFGSIGDEYISDYTHDVFDLVFDGLVSAKADLMNGETVEIYRSDMYVYSASVRDIDYSPDAAESEINSLLWLYIEPLNV